MLSEPVTIQEPAAKLVGLDEVRTYLRLDEGGLDTELEGYISGAIADIELITGTRLAPQLVQLFADSFADLGRLSIGPVSSVVSIEFQDDDGEAVTLSEDVYELFGAGLARGIRLKPRQSWPSIRPVTGAIMVELAVGYEKLPARLTEVLKESIRAKFDGSAIDLFSLTCNHRIWL